MPPCGQLCASIAVAALLSLKSSAKQQRCSRVCSHAACSLRVGCVLVLCCAAGGPGMGGPGRGGRGGQGGDFRRTGSAGAFGGRGKCAASLGSVRSLRWRHQGQLPAAVLDGLDCTRRASCVFSGNSAVFAWALTPGFVVSVPAGYMDGGRGGKPREGGRGDGGRGPMADGASRPMGGPGGPDGGRGPRGSGDGRGQRGGSAGGRGGGRDGGRGRGEGGEGRGRGGVPA